MRKPRLPAPDARDYECIKQDIARIEAENRQLWRQNEQANAEIARYRAVIDDLQKKFLQEVAIDNFS